MLISQAIETLDMVKPNSYTRAQKVKWLSDVDMQIYKEIVLTHNENYTEFSGYNEATDIETTSLIAPNPYDELYIHALKRQVDLNNEEYAKYNNDCMLFNSAYTNFYDWYNRKYLPKGEAGYKL